MLKKLIFFPLKKEIPFGTPGLFFMLNPQERLVDSPLFYSLPMPVY